MPSWSGDAASIQYEKLTHINYSFSLPDSNGNISAIPNDAKLRDIIARAKSKNVKVLLAVGGWNGGNDSAWENFTNYEWAINNFVNDAIYLVETYGLDAIDLDWEYPSAQWKWNALVNKLAPVLKS